MNKPSSAPNLGNSIADYSTSVAKIVLGAAPFVGPLLSEFAGTIIPNQRLDRIAKYCDCLEERLRATEREVFKQRVLEEDFSELLEEVIRQAAKAVTDERRNYLSSLVSCSLSKTHLEIVEVRHLLRILSELNDVEIIWLRFYSVQIVDGDHEFRRKHSELLEDKFPYNRRDREKNALQKSYKEHLAILGLLRRRFSSSVAEGYATGSEDSEPEASSYEITTLGKLLLKHIDLLPPISEADEWRR